MPFSWESLSILTIYMVFLLLTPYCALYFPFKELTTACNHVYFCDCLINCLFPPGICLWGLGSYHKDNHADFYAFHLLSGALEGTEHLPACYPQANWIQRALCILKCLCPLCCTEPQSVAHPTLLAQQHLREELMQLVTILLHGF